MPPEGCDEKRMIKCPYLTNEIISCENGQITDAILRTPAVVNSLLGFLDDPKLGATPEEVSGPALLVPSFCSKALCIVFGKKPAEAAEVIKAFPDILKKIVDRLVLPGVSGLLTKIVSLNSDSLAMANVNKKNKIINYNFIYLFTHIYFYLIMRKS